MADSVKGDQPIAKLPPTSIRCAVYTRKSTDEGLDHNFNSLDAQRLAAEDFVRSRRLEGWAVVAEQYDDGGFTGANTDRPALQRLLADVAAKKVNCVVVYKIDRLSRSIRDFLVLVEYLEKHGVTLVSVTQSIDTRSSGGRLLVNLLMMFAQYEREMTSERTRDKMHAARRKGKWIGGNVPIGYNLLPAGGALVVNDAEADQVRGIFGLYLDLGSLSSVLDELDRRGWRMKSWTTREGKVRGGACFQKTTLHKLLANPTYTGRIQFEGTLYKGEQPRIIDDQTWDQVQRHLSRAGRDAGRRVPNKYGGLLKSLVWCDSCGVQMSHTYTNKSEKIYRYYVCQRAHQRGWNRCETRSVSAPELEQAVVDQLRGFARQPAVLSEVIRHVENGRAQGSPVIDPEDVRQALAEFSPLWEELTVQEKVRFLRTLVSAVRYCGRTGKVTVTFQTEGIKDLCQTCATPA